MYILDSKTSIPAHPVVQIQIHEPVEPEQSNSFLIESALQITNYIDFYSCEITAMASMATAYLCTQVINAYMRQLFTQSYFC